nr:uncharacterized protein LOC113806507 [Penaeus vannamei]
MMTETELVVPRAPEASHLRPDASSTPAQKVAARPSALPRPRLLARAPPGHRPQSHSYPGTCKDYQGISGAPRVCVMDPEGIPKEETRAGDFMGPRLPAGGHAHAPKDSDCVLSYVHTNGSIAYPQLKHSCDTMNPNIRINVDDDDAFPTGPLRSSDSWDSFSTSPGSSENGDSVSSGSRGEEFSEDSEGDGFVDCGHDDFPFCQCLNEKAGGPPGLQCDHEEFPFCDCLARAAERKHKKTLGYRHPRGEGRRRRGYIGPSLSAFRDAGLEVFDETEESDFQESETETGHPGTALRRRDRHRGRRGGVRGRRSRGIQREGVGRGRCVGRPPCAARAAAATRVHRHVRQQKGLHRDESRPRQDRRVRDRRCRQVGADRPTADRPLHRGVRPDDGGRVQLPVPARGVRPAAAGHGHGGACGRGGGGPRGAGLVGRRLHARVLPDVALVLRRPQPPPSGHPRADPGGATADGPRGQQGRPEPRPRGQPGRDPRPGRLLGLRLLRGGGAGAVGRGGAALHGALPGRAREPGDLRARREPSGPRKGAGSPEDLARAPRSWSVVRKTTAQGN